MRIRGEFAEEAYRDYQLLLHGLKSLLPITVTGMAESLEINRNTLSGLLNGHSALDVADLARILGGIGLTTRDLLLYIWNGQPATLPFDLKVTWKEGKVSALERIDGAEVLAGVRSMLDQAQIPEGRVPYQLRWERGKTSNQLSRYIRSEVPMPWPRVLQTIYLTNLDPRRFAIQHLAQPPAAPPVLVS